MSHKRPCYDNDIERHYGPQEKNLGKEIDAYIL